MKKIQPDVASAAIIAVCIVAAVTGFLIFDPFGHTQVAAASEAPAVRAHVPNALELQQDRFVAGISVVQDQRTNLCFAVRSTPRSNSFHFATVECEGQTIREDRSFNEYLGYLKDRQRNVCMAYVGNREFSVIPCTEQVSIAAEFSPIRQRVD